MGKRQRKRERLAAKKPEPVEDIAEKITEDLVTEVIKVPLVELPKRPWWKFWERRETT